MVREVNIPDAITVQELANRMAERVAAVVKVLMQNGIMATQNQTIDPETAALIVEEFGHKVVRVSESDVEDVIVQASGEDEGNLKPRPPVVTIMGHVDHGKTSLLDAIRKTNVVSGEAGGITQHIGAYQVTTPNGALVTFLDTPGHAAFTSMRARGAQVTDIVVLVVAADDSVMPQTVEAISHAKAAGVPMIVAINKVDKNGADPNRVRTQLLNHEVVVEEMGGEVLDVEVSALTGKGLDTLLENIALQAELLDLKANPDRQAEGAVIEAKLDVGRGPVATVLVQKGTLRRGDIFVVGEQWGRVRALLNDKGERVEEAGPSVPVEVLGLSGTPEAGDVLNVVDDEAARPRDRQLPRAAVPRPARGGGLGDDARPAPRQGQGRQGPQGAARGGEVRRAGLGRGDRAGAGEALHRRGAHPRAALGRRRRHRIGRDAGRGLGRADHRLQRPRQRAGARGGEPEGRRDPLLLDHLQPGGRREGRRRPGLLSPEIREKFIGYAEILQVFKITGVGKVAGCRVTEGVARRSAGVRLLRDNVVIHEGKLKTLKRFKDEVREVQAGQECGMAFEHYDDMREGDVIEIFETETVERQLA